MPRTFSEQFKMAFFHESRSLRPTPVRTTALRGPAHRYLVALTRQSPAFSAAEPRPPKREDHHAARGELVDRWRSSEAWTLPRLNRQTRLASTDSDEATSIVESPERQMTIAMTALDRERTYLAIDVAPTAAEAGDVVIVTVDGGPHPWLLLLALGQNTSGGLVAGATVVDAAEWLEVAVQHVVRASALAALPVAVITNSVRFADDDGIGAWRNLAASLPNNDHVREAILEGLT